MVKLRAAVSDNDDGNYNSEDSDVDSVTNLVAHSIPSHKKSRETARRHHRQQHLQQQPPDEFDEELIAHSQLLLDESDSENDDDEIMLPDYFGTSRTHSTAPVALAPRKSMSHSAVASRHSRRKIDLGNSDELVARSQLLLEEDSDNDNDNMLPNYFEASRKQKTQSTPVLAPPRTSLSTSKATRRRDRGMNNETSSRHIRRKIDLGNNRVHNFESDAGDSSSVLDVDERSVATTSSSSLQLLSPKETTRAASRSRISGKQPRKKSGFRPSQQRTQRYVVDMDERRRRENAIPRVSSSNDMGW